MLIAGREKKATEHCPKFFRDFLLQKLRSHGIFKHLLTKGRPNLADFTTKTLSGQLRRLSSPGCFRASHLVALTGSY